MCYLVLVGIAIACAIIGVFVAPPLGMAMIRALGVKQVVFRDPDELLFRSLRYVFALPALTVIAIDLLDRVIWKAAPPVKRLAIYFAIVVVAIAAVFALELRSMHAALADVTNMEPMIGPSSFEWGESALKASICAAILLCAWRVRATSKSSER